MSDYYFVAGAPEWDPILALFFEPYLRRAGDNIWQSEAWQSRYLTLTHANGVG